MSEQAKDRDLVLAPNQYVLILDETKGFLSTCTGPYKTSLANSDRPVVFNAKTRKFDRAALESAIQEFPQANEGWYVVLENPVKEASKAKPPSGSHQLPELNFGRKVNMPGPATFALWPGQTATVIEGHRIRFNQYLLVRVYNEEEARQNWGTAVVKTATVESKPAPDGQKEALLGSGQAATKDDAAKHDATNGIDVDAALLAIGTQFIIRGDAVSFYIPPTGIEVLADENGKFVRDAVTLERLEYCILLDESGKKRIVIGPDVVFPQPTEKFKQEGGKTKFRAIELNDEMGIYVKVIADYEESDGKGGTRKYKTGEELFITGREQRMYYPREEHALIKYGTQERHYSVVIPDGEGRYVLNKQTGSIGLVKGPTILLPDPRKQVVIRRLLEDGQVALWYPGNQYALEYNRRLRDLTRAQGQAENALSEEAVSSGMPVIRNITARSAAADDLQRGTSYTPPRTLTLDTKYEGAVAVSIWTGYAVLIVNKAGLSRVVVGPKTALLEYDESLQVLELSRGKPKTTDALERTVYLKVANNHVTDIVALVTKDQVEANVKLSYRVSFEGDPARWFAVDNYVKFLCDHLRSVLRGMTKKQGIEQLNDSYVSLIRDAVLGEKDASGKRVGRLFAENDMRVHDVEVLELVIKDPQIAALLGKAQHEAVQTALTLATKQRELDATVRSEDIARKIADEKEKTADHLRTIRTEALESELKLALARLENEAQAADERLAQLKRQQAEELLLKATERMDLAADHAAALAHERGQMQQRIEELKAEVEAVVSKAGAISPQLIAALQAFGDKHVLENAVKSMAPMALLGGNSVVDVLKKALADTPLAKTVASLGVNGHAANGTSVES
ncbi:MAG: hypothetical protein RLZZ324_330 [Candidatus Parcubacteria bacterium]|jgi:major vault protein